jgi:hypothetical protein
MSLELRTCRVAYQALSLVDCESETTLEDDGQEICDGIGDGSSVT